MVILNKLAAALAFYTCLPIPLGGVLDFQRVSRLAPVVGLIIGGLLGLADWGFSIATIPPLPRSALLVVLWIAITGGLHLDGAMDTADGLAVTDPKRRLEVMADSATGAFGAMAAVSLILLKTAALTDIVNLRDWILPLVAGWARWGQQIAIVRYPYLKPTGKGAFHKQALHSIGDTVPSLILLLGLSGIPIILNPDSWKLVLAMALGGSTIAVAVPAWFNHKLGGHTGDTYGAVVEWTEALLLVLLTLNWK